MMHGVVSMGSKLVQSLSTQQPIQLKPSRSRAAKGPGHGVTYHISSKNVISSDGQVDEFKLGENYPGVKRVMFKVIRSNIEIAITLPGMARFRSNTVYSFIVSQSIYYQCSWSKGQRSRLQGQGHFHSVTYKTGLINYRPMGPS